MGQIGVCVAPSAIYEHPRAPIELRVAVAAEEFMLVVEIATPEALAPVGRT